MQKSSRRVGVVMGCVLSMCLVAAGASAAGTPDGSKESAVVDLGGGHYRIGTITVDKTKGEFSVPGDVLQLRNPKSPLEYIAVTKGGYKSYEAVFELDTSAVNFNLACIMIGLDASRAKQSTFHFDPQHVTGDPVKLFVSWRVGDKTRRVPVGDVLSRAVPSAGPDDWVYTGSIFAPNGDYAAESSGTLIGFVHDPVSIIDHRLGLGLGMYGSITMNMEVLPPPGTAVQFQVVRAARHPAGNTPAETQHLDSPPQQPRQSPQHP